MKPFPMYIVSSAEPEFPGFIKDKTLFTKKMKRDDTGKEFNFQLTAGDLFCAMQIRDLSTALVYASQHFENMLANPVALETFVKNVHQIVAKHLVMLSIEKIPAGEYRADVSNLGVAPAIIDGEMQKFYAVLFEMLQKCKTPEDAVTAGTYALTEICRVHPFSNGNGRVARILMNCIFSHFGKYEPIIFENSTKYDQCVVQYNKGNKEPLAKLIKKTLSGPRPPDNDAVTTPISITGTTQIKIYFDESGRTIGLVDDRAKNDGLALTSDVLLHIAKNFNNPDDIFIKNFLLGLAEVKWVAEELKEKKFEGIESLEEPTKKEILFQTTSSFFQQKLPSQWKDYPPELITGNFVGHKLCYFNFTSLDDEKTRDQFVERLEQEGFTVKKTQTSSKKPSILLDLSESKLKM